MAAELKKVELDITEEILNIGLSKAADSLSFFIKEKVLIQLVDLKVNSHDFRPLSKKVDINRSYLLTTNIRGDIRGKAYLVFNESEANKLLEVNFPDNGKSNPRERAIMMDAILLEVDNIITASVVTQFANILGSKLYGDVPMLNILERNELNPFLSEKNVDENNIMYINSRFITKNLDINPEFIWLMEDKFFNEVKNIVSDKGKMELLQKLNVNS